MTRTLTEATMEQNFKLYVKKAGLTRKQERVMRQFYRLMWDELSSYLHVVKIPLR